MGGEKRISRIIKVNNIFFTLFFLYKKNELISFQIIKGKIIKKKENKEYDLTEFMPRIHKTQEQLLELYNKGLLKGKGFRKIGRMIGILHPETIKHHLLQLKKKGLIKS